MYIVGSYGNTSFLLSLLFKHTNKLYGNRRKTSLLPRNNKKKKTQINVCLNKAASFSATKFIVICN